MRYCSPHAHMRDYSRRDDLIGLGYVLIYFFNGGELPWDNIMSDDKITRNNRVHEMKKKLGYTGLKSGPFRKFVKTCMTLERDVDPSYDQIVNLVLSFQFALSTNEM